MNVKGIQTQSKHRSKENQSCDVLSAVQEERGPRKSKKSSLSGNPCMSTTKKQQRQTQLIDANQQRYRVLIQILVSCFEQVRQNRSFQYLDKEQQNVILELVWFDCFLLRAACWTIDVRPIVENCEDYTLALAIKKIQELHLDLTELSIMETLILCRKEFGTSQSSMKQLDSIHEGALCLLVRYTLGRGQPWPRYGRLLMAIRSLGDYMQNRKSKIYILFMGIIKGLLRDSRN